MKTGYHEELHASHVVPFEEHQLSLVVNWLAIIEYVFPNSRHVSEVGIITRM